jgi:hypothetical protein
MHTNIITDKILELLGKKQLLVIGDSHSRTYENLKNVKVCYLGPVTAHNLCEDNTTSGGKNKLQHLLASFNPADTAILLVFGEIDCRMHILKNSCLNSFSLSTASLVTAVRYIRVINTILSMGFNVSVQGVHGARSECGDYTYPSVGLEKERNFIVCKFNDYLRTASDTFSYNYFDIRDLIVNPVSMHTRYEFLEDGVHLNNFEAPSPDLQSILMYKLLTCIQRIEPNAFQEKLVRKNFMNHTCKVFNPSNQANDYGSEHLDIENTTLGITDLMSCKSFDIELQGAQVIDNISLSFERTTEALQIFCFIKGYLSSKTMIVRLFHSNISQLNTYSANFAPRVCRSFRIFYKNSTKLLPTCIDLCGPYPLIVQNHVY